MSTASLVKAAEASQEPLEDYSPDAIAHDGNWRPVTIRDVEWALECVAESEAEIASIDAQLADVVKRAEARATKLKAMAERRASYFRGRVAEFAEANRGDLLVGTKKSRDFIAGRISWRKSGGRLRVTDKKELEAWLLTQPVEAGLFRMKIEPEMRAIQEAAKRDGLVPPGTEFEPEHDTIHVEAVSLALTKGE